MDEMEQMRHNARNTSLRIRRPKYIENALNMVPLKNELDLLCTDVEQVGWGADEVCASSGGRGGGGGGGGGQAWRSRMHACVGC